MLNVTVDRMLICQALLDCSLLDICQEFDLLQFIR